MISDGCRQRGFLSEHISANGITLQCGGGGEDEEEEEEGGVWGGGGRKGSKRGEKNQNYFILQSTFPSTSLQLLFREPKQANMFSPFLPLYAAGVY